MNSGSERAGARKIGNREHAPRRIGIFEGHVTQAFGGPISGRYLLGYFWGICLVNYRFKYEFGVFLG